MNSFSFPRGNAHRQYKIGDEINFNFTSEKLTPSFSYMYVTFDGNHHFGQECFDNYDITSYFKMVKRMSTTPLKDIIETWGRQKHFHFIHNPKMELLQLILKAANVNTFLTPERMPVLIQVGLYTDPEGANRVSGKKSPRIFFVIGENAVLYPICYDPYHEIYNASKKPKA